MKPPKSAPKNVSEREIAELEVAAAARLGARFPGFTKALNRLHGRTDLREAMVAMALSLEKLPNVADRQAVAFVFGCVMEEKRVILAGLS